MKLQPRHAEAHYYLGLTLRALGKLPEAIGHLEKATTLAPTLAVAYAHLGIAQREHGDLDAAGRRWSVRWSSSPDGSTPSTRWDSR